MQITKENENGEKKAKVTSWTCWVYTVVAGFHIGCPKKDSCQKKSADHPSLWKDEKEMEMRKILVGEGEQSPLNHSYHHSFDESKGPRGVGFLYFMAFMLIDHCNRFALDFQTHETIETYFCF